MDYYTVVPTKIDSGVKLCLQSLSQTLTCTLHPEDRIKAALSVTLDLLILEIKFLFFKNTQFQVNILPFS